MTSNHECPYCEEPQEYCNDDGFSQDEAWDEECTSCGKSYRLTGWYDECYNAHPADCLNGAPHNFKQIIGAPSEWFIGKFRCTACAKEEHRGGHHMPDYSNPLDDAGGTG